MNQNYIAVNTARIENDRTKLNQSVINVQKRMRELVDKVNLLSQNWQGDANAVFIKNMNEDYQLMNEFLGQIAALSQALAEAEQEYVNCEYDVQSRIQYLGI